MKLFRHLFSHPVKEQKKREEVASVSVPEYIPLPDCHMLAIADLHYITEEEWALLERAADGVDVVLLLGDIEPYDARRIRAVTPDHIRCLYVLGNHDRWGQYDELFGLEDMDGRVVSVKNGIRIAGLSGAPRYKDDPSWAMRTQEEMAEKALSVPAADILITHDSPYHYLNPNHSHEGYGGIDEYLKRNCPSLHLFGHHHIMHEGFYGTSKCVCIFRCALVDVRTGEVTSIF